MATLKTRYELGILNDSNFAEAFNESFIGFDKTIQHLSKTINDFRNFYKDDAHETNFKASDAIKECLEMIPMDGIDISFDFGKDISLFTFQGEFKQVLHVVVNNAKQAIESQNIIKGKIDISIKNEDNRVFIEIQDNAGGIPKYALSKIFEPYFSTKGKNGTGIGLNMARTIMNKRVKGGITAINQNAGACFVLEIPNKG